MNDISMCEISQPFLCIEQRGERAMGGLVEVSLSINKRGYDIERTKHVT